MPKLDTLDDMGKYSADAAAGVKYSPPGPPPLAVPSPTNTQVDADDHAYKYVS